MQSSAKKDSFSVWVILLLFTTIFTLAGLEEAKADAVDCSSSGLGMDDPSKFPPMGPYRPKYYGYYQGAISENPSMNLVWINMTDSDYLRQLKNASDNKQSVILNIAWALPFAVPNSGGNNNWDNPAPWSGGVYQNELHQFTNIVAFYISDEPPMNNQATTAALEKNIRYLKTLFPSIPEGIAYTAQSINAFCAPAGDGTAAWGGACDPSAHLPSGLGWVGFDFYFQGIEGVESLSNPNRQYLSSDVPVSSDQVWHGLSGTWRITSLLSRLEANLSSSQKVFLFPDASISVPDGPNGKSIPLTKPSQSELSDAQDFARWYYWYASTDSKVIALLPFMWSSVLNLSGTLSDTHSWGAQDLPSLRQIHENNGLCTKIFAQSFQALIPGQSQNFSYSIQGEELLSALPVGMGVNCRYINHNNSNLNWTNGLACSGPLTIGITVPFGKKITELQAFVHHFNFGDGVVRPYSISVSVNGATPFNWVNGSKGSGDILLNSGSKPLLAGGKVQIIYDFPYESSWSPWFVAQSLGFSGRLENDFAVVNGKARSDFQFSTLSSGEKSVSYSLNQLGLTSVPVQDAANCRYANHNSPELNWINGLYCRGGLHYIVQVPPGYRATQLTASAQFANFADGVQRTYEIRVTPDRQPTLALGTPLTFGSDRQTLAGSRGISALTQVDVEFDLPIESWEVVIQNLNFKLQLLPK